MRAKRIFIVMYNFMPIGIGRGIAWNNFADKLADNGYLVELITVEPSIYDPYYNKDKISMISKKIKVVRLKDADFYYKLYNRMTEKSFINSTKKSSLIKSSLIKAYKIFSRLFFYPDRMKFWSKKSRKYLMSKNICEKDLIISVAFPFSSHLEMRKIKKQTKCKLILDYGDPWSFNPSVETEPIWRKKFDEIIEKRLIKEADLITVTTDTTKRMFEKNFHTQKISVIRQGVDLEPYKKKYMPKEKANNLTLVYTGIFYKEIRDPSFFFDEVLKLDKLLKINVNLKIAGRMDDYFKNIIIEKKLNQMSHINLILMGNVGFKECIELQKKADILLLFSNKVGIQVPGKLYEYLATTKPIICITYSIGEAENILIENKRGIVLLNNDAKMHTKMLSVLNEYAKNNIIKGISKKKVYDYDWKNISEELVKCVNEVLK